MSRWSLIAIGSLACATANASVFMPTVAVDNPGNLNEWSGGTVPVYVGAVTYVYEIATHEVTAGQYTEFLNAVAATDTYGLYSTRMTLFSAGANIERTGSSLNYTYSVASDWASRPVNFVSWGDAARFANWMHNGQLTGLQDLNTTEAGSYFLDGVVDRLGLMDVFRTPDATWVIPTESEWYKAAYHKNDGATRSYFAYPTSSDSEPSNILDGGGNNATFRSNTGGATIGGPHHRTEVGAHANSPSPYGTFDQGGNVWEFNEAIVPSLGRGLRGGSFNSGDYFLESSFRVISDDVVVDEYSDVGFRLALVPEPATVALLIVGAMTLLRRR